jgi:acyl CoA:acetate/3-ketoacid CoA transferase
VPEVEHVTFSGRRARKQKQDVTYVTERCVIRLLERGLTVTELAPGVDLQRDVLAQAGIELAVAPAVKTMDARLFRPEPMALTLQPPRR